jgi:hypothetical protein
VEATERETTIQWSDADGGTATVFTAQRPMVTRLRRIRGAERVEIHRTTTGLWTGETWQVPVACVLPRNARHRMLTDAQRAEIRDRLSGVRNALSQKAV